MGGINSGKLMKFALVSLLAMQFTSIYVVALCQTPQHSPLLVANKHTKCRYVLE